MDVNVEKDYNLKEATVSCPDKTNTEFKISRAPGGFIFYEIKATQGSVASTLSGRYTSLDKAIEVLEKHLKDMTPTKGAQVKEAVTRHRKYKEDKDGATAKSKGS